MTDWIPISTNSKSEYKRDLPFGFGTSAATHVIAALVLGALFATAALIQEINVPVPEQKSTVITIETLVRTPLTTAQTHPSSQAQPSIAASASQSSASSSSPSQGVASAAAPSSSNGGMRSELSRLVGSLPHVKAAVSSVSRAFMVNTAAAGSAAAAGNTGSGGAVNSQSTISGPGPGDGMGGHAGAGPVWSEEPADGPFGSQHHDSCTPSKGGFFR
ncbi:MAG TPA: hypothetical protein VKF82_06770 [Candidatus Eremiobacteraceae bacterium]|nr:hypothetical protein [Candidatus Eremiobacteraceae bacterium]